MFKLNIKTDSGVISVAGIPTVELSRDLAQDKSEDSGIKLYDTDDRTYTEWLVSFMDSKELAMLNGGSNHGGDCHNFVDCYNFEKGYNVLSTTEDKLKVVKTINGVGPRESDGNIEFLGSKSADAYIPNGGEVAVISDGKVFTTANVVAFKRLTTANNNDELLYELYLMTMRLYHAYSYFARRILSFEQDLWKRQATAPDSPLPDPDSDKYAEAVSTIMEHKLGRLQGTLLNYQANVARWNYLVWKSSYIQHAEASRQNLLMSLGFAATFCGPENVKVVTTIECTSAVSTAVPDRDAAAYLTIYRQSASDDRQKQYDANNKDCTPKVTTKIKKYWAGEEEGVEIDGYGIEKEYKNWEKITITQDIPSMVQSDSYSELFVLSPGMGVLAYLYLPDSPNTGAFNEFKITTRWYIGDVPGVQPGEAPDDAVVPALTKEETVEVLSVCAERLPDDKEDKEEDA